MQEKLGASPEVAEGIYHLQPAPPLDAPSSKNFVEAMGAPEDTVFLFAGNIHGQVRVAALAMEHARTVKATVWAPSIRAVYNPPGENVDDVGRALAMVRAGRKIKVVGAGRAASSTTRATRWTEPSCSR